MGLPLEEVGDSGLRGFRPKLQILYTTALETEAGVCLTQGRMP